jgi:hypothetical protein
VFCLFVEQLAALLVLVLVLEKRKDRLVGVPAIDSGGYLSA